MPSHKQLQIQKQMQSVYGLIQQGQSRQALDLIKGLLRKDPQNPDVVHLAALAHKGVDNVEESERFFNRSLMLNKQQPQVFNNLGNLLLSQQRYSESEKSYRKALKLQPGFIDAQRNLALCLYHQQQFQAAVEVYSTVLQSQGQDVSALAGLADSYRNLEDYAAAEQTYHRAIAVSPQHLNATHNLGLTYHLMGKLDKALLNYKRAYGLDPDKAEVVQSYANALLESGATEAGLEILRNAVAQQPLTVLLHERLNEVLWELESDEFGESYQRAIATTEDNLSLRIAFIKQLFRAEKISEADALINESLALAHQNPQLLALHGQVNAELGHYGQAVASLNDSLELEYSKEAGHPLAKLHIIREDYRSAQDVIDNLMRLDPECQLTWALQGTNWRLQNNEQYQWLNDYHRFVKSYTLPVPEGYQSLDEFLLALKAVLLAMHQTQNAPLQQTLRNGTQTAARLLHNPAPELQALKQSLSSIIADYIEALPDDESHPLLRRKSSQFEFSGSWSVKLKPDGFHVNHVHPQGWISSSCYISIPESMHDADPTQAGWIKFGESPLALGDREVVERTIKPEAGMVVLFPSYMWHGTNPFQGEVEDFRLTSPFDVAPI